MLKYLKSWSGRSSRLVVLALALIGSTSLAGCSGPLKLLTGGGPNVAANVQAGKTNSQSVGETSNVEQTITRPVARRDVVQSNDDSKVKSDSIEKVVVNEVPVWVILLLVLGWLLPSPGEMMRVITRPFSKRS